MHQATLVSAHLGVSWSLKPTTSPPSLYQMLIEENISSLVVTGKIKDAQWEDRDLATIIRYLRSQERPTGRELDQQSINERLLLQQWRNLSLENGCLLRTCTCIQALYTVLKQIVLLASLVSHAMKLARDGASRHRKNAWTITSSLLLASQMYRHSWLLPHLPSMSCGKTSSSEIFSVGWPDNISRAPRNRGDGFYQVRTDIRWKRRRVGMHWCVYEVDYSGAHPIPDCPHCCQGADRRVDTSLRSPSKASLRPRKEFWCRDHPMFMGILLYPAKPHDLRQPPRQWCMRVLWPHFARLDENIVESAKKKVATVYHRNGVLLQSDPSQNDWRESIFYVFLVENHTYHWICWQKKSLTRRVYQHTGVPQFTPSEVAKGPPVSAGHKETFA